MEIWNMQSHENHSNFHLFLALIVPSCLSIVVSIVPTPKSGILCAFNLQILHGKWRCSTRTRLDKTQRDLSGNQSTCKEFHSLAVRRTCGCEILLGNPWDVPKIWVEPSLRLVLWWWKGEGTTILTLIYSIRNRLHELKTFKIINLMLLR